MPRLVGYSHEVAGKAFELSGAVVTVGRTANNNVHLPDNSVSSRHAELRLEGLDYMVKDLDSTNGTRVNGEKITTANLRRSDVLRFGNIEVVYESEHEPVTVPLPELVLGLNLEGCSCHGAPAHFAPLDGTGKSKKKDSQLGWVVASLLTGLLAFSAIGFLVFRLLSSG